MVDATEGVLGVEWIEGKSVRLLLGGGAEDEQEAEVLGYDDSDEEPEEEYEVDPLLEYEVKLGEFIAFLLDFH
jgi:TP53 regulating kinase-like protein